jgi:hypothetical protein
MSCAISNKASMFQNFNFFYLKVDFFFLSKRACLCCVLAFPK